MIFFFLSDARLFKCDTKSQPVSSVVIQKKEDYERKKVLRFKSCGRQGKWLNVSYPLSGGLITRFSTIEWRQLLQSITYFLIFNRRLTECCFCSVQSTESEQKRPSTHHPPRLYQKTNWFNPLSLIATSEYEELRWVLFHVIYTYICISKEQIYHEITFNTNK